MAIDKDLVSSIVAEVLKKLEETPPKPAAVKPRTETAATAPSPRDLERRPPGQTGVPFITAYDKVARPFEDLAGSYAVDDPEKMLKGWTRPEETVVRPELAVGKYVTSPERCFRFWPTGARRLRSSPRRARISTAISAHGAARVFWSHPTSS